MKSAADFLLIVNTNHCTFQNVLDSEAFADFQSMLTSSNWQRSKHWIKAIKDKYVWKFSGKKEFMITMTNTL